MYIVFNRCICDGDFDKQNKLLLVTNFPQLDHMKQPVWSICILLQQRLFGKFPPKMKLSIFL